MVSVKKKMGSHTTPLLRPLGTHPNLTMSSRYATNDGNEEDVLPGKIQLRRSASCIILASFVVVLSLFDGAVAFSAQPPPPSNHRSPCDAFASSLPINAPKQNIRDPHMILGIDRSSTDVDIQRAYRELARKFHPDIVVGPDATPDERREANEYFAQINEAYENLKSKQDEEIIEIVIMGGNFATGKRDRRVTIKTSEEIRNANPNRVNYDQIIQNRNRSNLKGRNWNDPEELVKTQFPQGGRHNGDFGPPRWW